MVRLDRVKSANLDLVVSQPVVAVFVGGTSGIGESTIRALAATHADIGKGLRLYLVGRNTKVAESILADCRKACPRGNFIFVQSADLSLLAEIDTVCEKVIQAERSEAEAAGDTARIDFLFMSQACPPWLPEKVTTEGIEQLYSLLYYSRMRCITRLIPLLTAALTPSHIVSVYAAGKETKLLTDDLLLRKQGNCTLAKIRSHVTYMTTLFMEHLAEQYPGRFSLMHIFPGLVVSQAFKSSTMPTFYRILWDWLGRYIAPLIAVPVDESGIRMMSLATSMYPAGPVEGETPLTDEGAVLGTNGSYGSGVYALNWDGEAIAVANKYHQLPVSKENASKMILDHAYSAFRQIEAGQVFTG